MTFITINPVLTKKYVPKTRIVSTSFKRSDNKKAYYKGELNDENNRHGAGLMI